MIRACRPSPAWRRWGLVACAATALAARPAAAQDCASPSFGASSVSFPVTDSPRAVVEGDFWGAGGLPDGKLDVVVVRDGTDVVTLLTGIGTGAFGDGGSFPVGADPRDVVTADFDRDGFLDVAVANSFDGTVSLLEGTGSSFVVQTAVAVGGTPTRLAVGDFDHNGRPDLVVVSPSPGTVQVLLGQGDFTFTLGSNRTLPVPTAAATGDIDGDGNLDLLVTLGTSDQVAVYLGRGDGYIGSGSPWTTSPARTVGVGDEPTDIAVADVDDDGDLDFVTADRSAGSAATSALTVRRGDGLGDFPDIETANPAALVDPVRVALADIDRDGIVDVAALDGSSIPAKVMVLRGTGDWRQVPLPPTPMTFDDANPFSKPLTALPSRDLALGDINGKGRLDFVVAEDNTTDGFVSVALNSSGPDCPRTSFGDAPRAFTGGNSPWALAVADFNEDGVEDLVTAHANQAELSLLRGTGNGYLAPVNAATLPVRAWGVATADFDFDGHADLVAALGNGLAAGTGTDGQVFVLRGDGTGAFSPMATLASGLSVTAVAVGDFDGDGGPDIAATSDETDQLFIFLGDGVGGFSAAPESPRALGAGADPSALAVGAINGDMVPDLAVARYGLNDVAVLLGDGDGTFTSQAAVTVGAAPWSVALGPVNGDGLTDLVTANFSGGDVSLVFGDGNGAFSGLTSQTGVSVPISVAVLDATDDGAPDVLVTTSAHTLVLFAGPYLAGFASQETYAVRQRPSQVVPLDADGDGKKDLVIPCKDSGDVSVLLARPPGPPVFLEARTVPVDANPVSATAGDFDRDGDVDLAVVNRSGNSITILANDGAGGFTPSVQSPIAVGTTPVAIVAVDLDLDGKLDLAVSCAGANQVQFYKGDGALGFPAAPTTPSLALTQPDDLVAGDFDRDGDPDLAVLSRSGNSVQIVDNNRAWGLSPSGTPYTVGTSPTSIFAADFNWDGILDLVVANDDSDNLRLLTGVANGTFTLDPTPLGLGGDTSPLSVTGGDFDADGDVDLATVAFGNHRLILFRNTAGTFPSTPSLKLDAPREPSYVTTADINRDGLVDLTMAAAGLKVTRGTAGFTFLGGEDFLAGRTPIAVVPADFNRDGLPDVAVVNSGSDDVSILLSTACVRRRLVVSASPSACPAGPSPFSVNTEVQVQDDGGNLLTCEGGTVNASLAAGTGLSGGTSVGVAGGSAVFNALNISPGGVRFVLQFDLTGVPPVLSRSFSLEPTVEIVGPTSVCPSLTESYSVSESLDSYFWSLSPAGPGYPTFTPTTSLAYADLTPDQLYTLALQGRVDGCAPSDSVDVYVGNLFAVTIASNGPLSACVDCFGATFTATETGGGTPTGRQWGYRTVSTIGVITPIPGETDQTYVFKGTDFPGPGSYFIVETTTPPITCGSPVDSNEIAVTVTASVPTGEVQSLGALSRGSASSGENVLQWANSGSLDHVLIRWNKAPTGTANCTPPLDPFVLPVSGETSKPYGGSPPARDSFAHGGLEPDTAYCYTVFATTDGTNYDPGRIVKARPFDSSGSPVKWAYATGATAVAPPVVAQAGIVALSNDRTVHSLLRGINGGIWPGAWMPATLTGVAHSRSPVVPLAVPVGGADALLFVGDDTGDVFAIDASTGNVVWGPQTPAPSSEITGAPGGLFVQYGAPSDVVVVGTRNDPLVEGALHTLSLATGSLIDSYSATGAVGPVTGTPVIDNAGGRVWFSSFSKANGPSLWCVEVDVGGMMSACAGFTPPNLGNVVTSPVLRGGRLYVSNTSGEVYSVDAATGVPGPVFLTSDGAAKGFLWPDRRTDLHDGDLYFATNSRVWSVKDSSGTLTENWSWNAGGTLEPSTLLQWPQTNLLYVGSQSGTLYELDFTSADMVTPPVVDSRTLGAGIDHVGAPSLDIGLDPPDVSTDKELLLVGSEAGVLYAVEVPFNP